MSIRSFLLTGSLCFLAFPMLASESSPYGINRDGEPALPEVARLLPQAGIQWVRLTADWRLMEPSQGTIQWTNLDARIDAAEAAGLDILLSFVFVPAWANGSSVDCEPFVDLNCSDPPTDPEFFADFVTEVAKRYLSRIGAYGIWNEPTLEVFWGGTLQEYVDEILVNGSQAIKAVDATAKIVGPDTVFDSGYFADVIGQACASLDVLSAHFYPTSQAGATGAILNDFNNNYLDAIKKDCPKPFWITEYGFNSFASTQAIQAAEYKEVYEEVLAIEEIEKVFIYRVEDHPLSFELEYGILDDSYSPKPAFIALKDHTDEVLRERGISIDETLSGFLRLSGGGVASLATLSNVTTLPWGFDGCSPPGNPCSATDGKWNAENDGISGSLVGWNILAAHPAFENAPEMTITLSGLPDGAPFRVFVKFGTDPAASPGSGLRAKLGNQSSILLNAAYTPHGVVRRQNSWQEREVELGTENATNGQIQVKIDDDPSLFEAVFMGIRLESTFTTGMIFRDGFESGDTGLWN